MFFSSYFVIGYLVEKLVQFVVFVFNIVSAFMLYMFHSVGPTLLRVAGVALGLVLLGLLLRALALLLGALLCRLGPDYSPGRCLTPGDAREACALCDKCRCVVRNSRLLGGNIPWWRAGLLERYDDFYNPAELEVSARGCHLCALLCSSYGYERERGPTFSAPMGVEIRYNGLSLWSFLRRGPPLYIRLYPPSPWPYNSSRYTPLLVEASFDHPGHDCYNSQSLSGARSEMHWAQSQIISCAENHKACRNEFVSRGQKRFLPRRLIDVRQSDGGGGVIRLVERHDLDRAAADGWPTYFALSHCWGGTVRNELNEANQDGMRIIPVARLDRNFRDAVAITKEMGVDYLWIDSLCIMQRSPEWEQQSGEMGLIYANARCVISATASRDSEGGCYRRRDMARLDCVLALDHGNGSLIVRRLPEKDHPALTQVFSDEVEDGPLTQRGWTFQERFLASRVLHFCSGLALFECNTIIASQLHGEEEYMADRNIRWDGKTHALYTVERPREPTPKYEMVLTSVRKRARALSSTGTRHFTTTRRKVETKRSKRAREAYLRELSAYLNRRERVVRTMFEQSARLGIRGAFRFLMSFRGTEATEKIEFHARWYEIVNRYSVRQLTNAEDKLIALAGIAYFIQTNNDRLTYAAGLWAARDGDDFLLALNLLWAANNGNSLGARPAFRLAPSWSWASIDGSVSHRLKSPDTPLSARYLETGSGSSAGQANYSSWKEITLLVSRLSVKPLQTIRDMVQHAALDLSCTFSPFDPRLFDAIYDTTEQPPVEGTICLFVLRFVKSMVRPATRAAKFHGILVVKAAAPVAVMTAEDGGDEESPPDCYRRVGYFWNSSTDGAPVSVDAKLDEIPARMIRLI